MGRMNKSLLVLLLAALLPAADPVRPLDVTLTSRVRGYFYSEHQAAIDARTGIPARYVYGELDRRMADTQHPPDVAELGLPGGLDHLDRVLDLRPFLAEDSITPEQFVPGSLAPWRRGEAILAIPRDLTVTCLAWSAARAQEAGVDPAATSATWEDLATAARAWRQRTGRPYLAFPKSFAGVVSLCHQRKALTVNERGRPVVTGSAAVAVLSWYVRAVWGPEPIATIIDRGDERDRGVAEGDPLVWYVPVWDFHSYGRIGEEQRLAYALAPLPAWEAGGHRSVLMYGQALAIHRDCPDPRRAWALVRALLRDPALNQQSLYQQKFLSPWKPAWDLPEMNRRQVGFVDPQPLRFQQRLSEDVPTVDARLHSTLLYTVLTETAATVGERLRADPRLDVPSAVAAALTTAQARLDAGAAP